QTPSFDDVPTHYWAYAEIEYLVEHGLVGGYSDGLYRPTASVTRGQMAVYIARTFLLL
ncbi:MAG: S-layer homology domain-containing protein, partial [Armatimonadetes bacterium]|nr:S-layer homology domain-containing protein [Armatimonadota bacterium]